MRLWTQDVKALDVIEVSDNGESGPNIFGEDDLVANLMPMVSVH